MSDFLSLPLLWVSVLSLPGLILIHLAGTRLILRTEESKKVPQILLVKFTALMNIILFVTTVLISVRESRDLGMLLSMLVYILVVFNGAAYVYFHTFNMSDTGRRVRMIVEVKRQQGLKLQELMKTYAPEQQVDARLMRLLKMRQIREENQRFYISGNIFLLIANAIRLWRRMLGLWSKERI